MKKTWKRVVKRTALGLAYIIGMLVSANELVEMTNVATVEEVDKFVYRRCWGKEL